MTKQEKRTKARRFLRHYAGRDGWFVCDTETTGPDAHEDEVVEISILTAQGVPVVDTLVRHSGAVEISEGAAETHGIHPEDIESAPTMDMLVFVDVLLSTHTTLIYNTAFDVPILRRSFERQGAKPSVGEWDTRCVMKAYAMAEGEWDDQYQSYSWVKLEQACMAQGVKTDDVELHRARGDAELTRRLVHSFEES